MGTIYKSTKECIIWLGDVNDESIQPYEPVQSINPVELAVLQGLIQKHNLQTPNPLQKAGKNTTFLDIPGALEIAELIARDIHFWEMPFYRILPDGGIELSETWHKAVYSLENILQRSWWKRIWTAQEAFLPSNSTIHIGSHLISYEVLLKASHSWGDHIHSYNHTRWENCCASILSLWFGHSSPRPANALFEQIEELNSLEVARVDHQHGSVAHNLFLLSMQRRATLPHDRVYGLFGLISEFFPLDEAPNYRLSLLHVYQRTTITFMENAEHLCLLSLSHPENHEHVEDKEKREYLRQLPTWCPDWNGVALRDYFDIHNHGQFSADKRQAYDGGHIGDAILKLEGFVVATIPLVAPLISDMKVPPSEFVPAIQAWLDLAESKGLTSQALWEIIHVATHNEVGLETLAQHDEWWAILKDLAKKGATYQNVEVVAKGTAFEHYQSSMICLRNRAVFSVDSSSTLAGADRPDNVSEYRSTLPKGTIGLSMPNVREGDYIYIVKGGRTPIIFRPIDGEELRAKALEKGVPQEELSKCFTYVGVTYIHGMMQGQAVPDTPSYDQIYIL